MNVFYSFILFTLITQSIYSQKSTKSEIYGGLNAAYSFDLVKAEEIFSKIIKGKPDHPAGYYFISQIYLWKFLGGNDQGDKGIFLKYADLSIKKSEDKLRDNESSELYFYLGSANQLKAVALIYEGEFWDAYGFVKDAINNLEESLELNPNNFDAYLGLGIFNYTLSYVPSFYRFLMGIFGLSSDKEKGFEQIKIAAEKGDINKIEAQFYMARILSDYFGDYNKSSKISKELISKFPNNVFILYQDALTALLNKNTADAEKSINRIIEISNHDFQQTNSFAFLRLGDISFRRNNFVKAIYFYEKFLSETRSFEFSGYAYYQIALCYAFNGNDSEMKRNLIFARNGNLDIPEDFYAKEKSNYYFDKGFSIDYLKLIKIENFLYLNDYDNAEVLLNEINNDKTRQKYLILKSDYFKAQIFFHNRNYEMSIKTVSGIKAVNETFENWIVPASKILAAEAYLELKKYAKVEEYLVLAEKENIYEFSEQFDAKIRKIHKNLKELKNNSKNVK